MVATIASLAKERDLLPAAVLAGDAVYTCPMHPEVRQNLPGNCPKCGMTLEKMTATVGGDTAESSDLQRMMRRFWIGSLLTLPVFLLAMMHAVPVVGSQDWVDGDVSRWVQFALTTPVVGWAGWPFFRLGWHSVVTRQLNMFTLIAIGVGAAFAFSVTAMLMPELFPPSLLFFTTRWEYRSRPAPFIGFSV